ncbi:MAG TPA: urea ABC transporter ATP-binding protein UrtD [Steroidobacteraceae bacterium]|nr:urea ABC transporter ATP-binding protein UrtD [Steroidobacteraceae bacterium]
MRETQSSTPDAASAAKPQTGWENSILFVDDVSVSFDGFLAIEHLSLVLEPGELRCIIGPNGAGKTTMLDVITGKTRPTSGRVFMHGQRIELTSRSEYEIARLGVGRKFQRPTVFPGHTVAENLELALAAPKGVFRSLLRRVSPAEGEKLDQILATVGLRAERTRAAGLLSHGQKQWLEIGMLLAQDPRVLLVDEPVAGMTHQEVERTAELLLSLAGAHTVVVIEHDMDFVRSIARKVTVLHEGSVLAEGTMEQVQRDPRVTEVYLGEAA